MQKANSAEQIHRRRAFGFVLMSAIAPGSVQLFTGKRRMGRLALRCYGVVLGFVALLALGLTAFRGFTVGLLLNPVTITLMRIWLAVFFLGWLVLLVDAWRLAQPLRLSQRPRLLLALTTVCVALSVGAVNIFASNALIAAGNVAEVFQGGGDAKQKAGRYNILLLGADADADREGLRPDSINVASIDAKTGRTVIFGLPRNLEGVRFPESSPLHALYPDGYDCADHSCLLNAVYQLGAENAKLYPGVADPGLAATKEAVSQTLGLELNYYALIDMQGFQSLVDAMGGIQLNIGKDILIGGGTSPISGSIKSGNNVRLDGYHALWFARSRAESSDYERMVRQKCVMSAMAKQLNPQTVATRFVELSQAGKGIVKTDVSSNAVVELAELAYKAKALSIESVNFVPPLIAPGNPNFDQIRSTVTDTIAASQQLDAAGGSTTTRDNSATTRDSAEPAKQASQAATPSSAGSTKASVASSKSSSESKTSGSTASESKTSDEVPVCTVS